MSSFVRSHSGLSRLRQNALKVSFQSRRPRRNFVVVAGQLSGSQQEHVNARSEDDGPPLRYDRELLRQYWSQRASELNQRYLAFAAKVAPFVGSVLKHFATRTLTRDDVISQLAVQAREGMESLGPTYGA